MDPYQILNLPPDATEEQIRQAYLDLARVWHPDRFQSDARLQKVAQERLQQVNSAYQALKSRAFNEYASHDSSGRTQSSGSGTQSARHDRGPAATRSWASRPGETLGRRLSLRLADPKFLARIGVALAGLLLLLLAVRIVPLLRAPVLDIDLLAGRARISRPQILTPARILDPGSDVKVAADALAEWARGEVLDLWKPAGWSAQASAAGTSRAIELPQPGATAKPNPKRTLPQKSSTLANATELLEAGRSNGAGELQFINNTDAEAIATVLRRQAPHRAIYIRPRSEALVRSIETGVYYVRLELGSHLDIEQLRFSRRQSAPQVLGPFQFYSLTTAGGTSGQHFEIVVNPTGPAGQSGGSRR
jgi:hypothetical protein